ncbi:uncharacterized protein LOC123867224 isoform X2 [Maniola jurtina]|uniref:uncharacterized protein LOC123867224 isoform X2 n=1 Tax=Maniola jurtina TaxID=191418 RepID=UPI001E686C32|nr:uncharacterized protein LOC123867224 isoform X2 [Maniola jurtina]
MENTFLWLLLSGLVSMSVPANGCAIDGIDWFVAASESILDTFRGNIWDRSTSNIDGIQDIEYTEGLNNGPYVTISHTDSRLIVSTNDAFKNYEEYETAMSMGFTITFRCTGGGTNRFVFEIRINDTNNNDPQFRPSNTYEFIIAPPIPPGFLITNCVDDIIVRDIDLTTQRIDFELSGSTLFQITYDNTSTIPKEFKAALRTTTFIRSIPEPIILTVTATDVDRTGDPRRTATATVKVVADTEFNFPDEPIFSLPFYLATYTSENELILQDTISLRQGFDEEVVFSLEGQHSQYFELAPYANEVTFKIKAPVPVELYKEGQILLVVKAERTYTSGATATVVVELPKAIELQFEAGVYEGSIEDNKLNLENLKLKQGYEDTTITVDIISDYNSYFKASVSGNIIAISMNPLSDSIVKGNNFINLQVTATTASNRTATTIVTLEIIKDDITTPVFEKNLYSGSYDHATGLNLEQIILIQGFDNTVTFTLEGEYSTLFEKKEDGPNISLSLSSLPAELFAERNILVSVRATKPRTVGANTVVQVSLPKARELSFEKLIYKGNLEENIITLDTIVLNVGYESDVIFSLTGDHVDYFNLNITKNKISLDVKKQIPENVLENSFFVMFLSASGNNTVTSSATILLETIKQDTVTPAFSKYIYEGTYINSTNIDFETISLIQGYDDTVTFDLDGEHARYFSINSAENRVMLTLKSTIPEDLIFKEKVLLFSVKAEKPRTVGANAAISLRFPQDLTEPVTLRFSQNTYRGLLKDDKLTVDNIVLQSGFTTETKFLLSGDSVENFTISNSNNVISIELSDTVSLEDLKKNKYIVLEIEATRERAVPVISTLIVDIPADTPVTIPVFEKAFYTGTYTKDSGLEFTELIALKLGFDKTVTFTLEGDNAQWFSVLQDENLVSLISNDQNPLPDEVLLENQHLLFTIIAQKPDTIGGRAAISITLIKDSDIDTSASFDKVLYNGNLKGGVISHETIRLTGFTGSNINITGELATSFKANAANDYVTVVVGFSAVFPENLTYIVLTLQADSANAVLIIDVTPSDSDIDTSVSFDKILYNGNLKGGVISHEIIRLTGFTGSNINITGELATSFKANAANGYVTVVVGSSAVFPENLTYIVLTLQADSANAVLIIDVTPSDSDIDTSVSFDKILYNGNLKSGVISHETIRLTGFTGSTINITGELATLFEANLANGYVTVDVILSAVFPENLTHIVLNLQADSANAFLIIYVTPSDSDIDTSVSFDKVLYNGNLKSGVLSHETIRLTGFTGSTINITGELATLFEANAANSYVTVVVSFSAVFPENLTYIVLTLQADSANAVLIIAVTPSDSDINTSVSFDKVLYNGNLKGDVISHETIRLTGFTGPNINITGELATLFEANIANGYVTVDVILSAVFPENLTHIVLTLQADSANAVLILDVTPSDSDIDTSVSFDKVLYNGNLKGSVISHETIRLTGFTGSNINITEELATLFEANVANGYVTVDVILSAVFPENLTYIVLTLQADSAYAVLILDVMPSDASLPIVSFGSPSYFLWADINQTGSVGRVKATVSNGESVLYSITVVGDLQERVSINAEGEILLLISLDKGIYNFKVIATAETSQVSATAQVILRVDALPECSTEAGLPPLIILERVEEEPHLNLIVLNQTQNEDCWYTITSIWPEDQSWLYVDNRGLHARAIDREHKSIAFMILSQIQVELILHCDNDDERGIVKRSLATETRSVLDPYTYGSSNWVLADTITYNARRSVVNLIVEDINDNPPIFVGKEDEPIYVGYPIPELENTILPRALIELKATDADIGENAALIYWSEEENLAIAATTGYVHVQNNALLTDNSRLTVYAIDQNGKGLNGTLDIVVKLLERNQIAVITVRNAFLHDENSILSNLSKLVGYDVKILRTVVISDINEETEEPSRRKRETANTSGASLQLFVYGISGSQLVSVDKLTSDLDNVVSANSVRVTSLEDHLEGLEICSVPGQHTALLAATITLAVVLFILIVAATIWFLLEWRKKQNYEKFSDANSLTTSIETEPIPKVETPPKPRLDIEELKRSERRLQEMLDAPLPEITVHPPKNETNKVEEDESITKAQETLINITADPQQPIIIQSIDKLKDNTDDLGEDEYGEVTVTTPRKSVVTFNENVEKIIHLEYDIDETPSEPDTEVYRF